MSQEALKVPVTETARPVELVEQELDRVDGGIIAVLIGLNRDDRKPGLAAR